MLLGEGAPPPENACDIDGHNGHIMVIEDMAEMEALARVQTGEDAYYRLAMADFNVCISSTLSSIVRWFSKLIVYRL